MAKTKSIKKEETLEIKDTPIDETTNIDTTPIIEEIAEPSVVLEVEVIPTKKIKDLPIGSKIIYNGKTYQKVAIRIDGAHLLVSLIEKGNELHVNNEDRLVLEKDEQVVSK